MHRFRNILVDVPVDQPTPLALDRAAALAARSGARLTAVDVVPDIPRYARLLVPPELGDLLVRDREERLAAITQPLERPGLAIERRILVGSHALEVIREVIRGGHDLLMRTHAVAQPYGPIDMALLRKCPCPVWLIAPAPVRLSRVVAAVNPDPEQPAGAELNARILDLARSVADAEGADLAVLHAWSLMGESVLAPRLREEELRAALDAARDAAKRQALDLLRHNAIPLERLHLRKGLPELVIPEFVATSGKDLLVMGTVARTGVAGLVIGNTAEKVLRRVQCSLLALKPPGFVSPVTVP